MKQTLHHWLHDPEQSEITKSGRAETEIDPGTSVAAKLAQIFHQEF